MAEQIAETKKNPNWLKADQWAIFKRGWRFELETTENKSRKRSGRELNSEPPNYKSNALTARPRDIQF